MLHLTVIGEELYDEEKEEFFSDAVTLRLEHSLVAVSKWESEHFKPFLAKGERTAEETESYVRAMIIDANPPEDIVKRMSHDNLLAVNSYIESPATATTFGAMPDTPGRRAEVITSELIYYWMVAFQIPFEAQHWHLNRLLALIRICNIKNTKPKKRSKQEIAQERRVENARRRKELGTNG